MNQPPSTQNSDDTELLVAVAESSAWIALLHGPRRTPAVERGLQQWLEEKELHRSAFEHATDTWNRTRGTVRKSARVEVSVPQQALKPRRQGARWRVILATAATGLMAIGLTLFFFSQRASVSTSVGERRMIVLEDGTQVSLNTATRLLVRYSEQRRQVQLISGEALFDVAKQAHRPFVVIAGNREVTALGTAFLVRRDEGRIAVTLVDGKITVSPETPSAPVLVLVPGQRIVFAQNQEPMLDRPVLEKLTAWQQGLVNIDNLPLAEAAAEMNRYSALQLEVQGLAAGIRVSGVFRVTDSENLAKAVALTHSLLLRKRGQRIVLSGVPQPPSESRFDPQFIEVEK